MIGLNSSLTLASEALSAQYAGMAVANNNIANVNTPGYSREVATLSSVSSVQDGTSVAEGVAYEGYTSVRDQVLNQAINSKNSDLSSLQSQDALLTQVGTAFSGTDSGIGSSISSLFSSLSVLSTSPTDSSARQAVLTSAQQVADAFHQAANALQSASDAANANVRSSVTQINSLSQQIAKLNGQLASVSAGEEDTGALQDQRDQFVSQLAQLTGIATTNTESSTTITTAGGSPLVIGDKALALQVTTGSDGTAHILGATGEDITNRLTGGALGGNVQVRDNTIANASKQLDQLASQFAAAMNAAQNSGYDLSGQTGSPMFRVPVGQTGSAANITVSLQSASGIAISADGSPGDTGNLQALLGVQTSKLPSRETPGDSYATLVGDLGTAGSQVKTEAAATSSTLQQLTTQRDSTSGVSLDEETTNLIRFQQAYTAAAKVISTLNDLYSVVMNMGSGGN